MLTDTQGQTTAVDLDAVQRLARELAEARQALEQFDAANAEIMAQRTSLKARENEADAKLRAAVKQYHEATGEKQIPLVGEIKDCQVVVYDVADATLWARLEAPQFLRFDAKAYERELMDRHDALAKLRASSAPESLIDALTARLLTMPGTIVTEPKPYIKRDLSALLDLPPS